MGKNKKNIAWILIVIMLINLVPLSVLADSQNPAKNLVINQVGHTKDGAVGDTIIPIIKVDWNKPDVGEDNHGPDYYQFEITDVLKDNRSYLSERLEVDIKQDDFSENAGKYYFGANENGIINNNSFRMTNGKLYKLSVIPRHLNPPTTPTGSSTLAPQTGVTQYKYLLTDFNTQMQERDGVLEVIWEYIPGATYELAYIAADKSTKEEIRGPISGDTNRVIKTIDEQDIKDSNLKFVENGITKIRYPIKEAKPGEKYSAYVEVVDLKHDNYTGSFNEIQRNNKSDIEGPKVVKGVTAIDLEIYNIGRNLIEINWENNAWAVLTGQLQRVLVYGGVSKDDMTLKATKYNTPPSTIKSIIIDEPKEDTYYYIDFVFKDEKTGIEYIIKSKIVQYLRSDLKDQPLKPKVPKPWGKNVNMVEENKKDYLVTGDDKPIADPNFKDNTFHAKIDEKTSIQLVWDIPKDKENNPIIEPDITYDIWVAEDKSRLDKDIDTVPIAKDIFKEGAKDENIIYSTKGKKPIGFKWTLNHYIDLDGELKEIVSNKTYYIKIVAKRANGEGFKRSQPTVVTITIDKNGDIFTPPVLGKPPLQLDNITMTTATIKWLEVWHEILAKNPKLYTDKDENTLATIGSAKVYVDENKSAELPIRYKKDEGRVEEILFTQGDVDRVKNKVNGDDKNETEDKISKYDKGYYDRLVRLGSDIKYELKVLEYSELEKELGSKSIEEWIVEKESETPIGTKGWSDITPNESSDAQGLKWKDYTIDKLKANTRYVLMIRAYRVLEDGSKQKQTFPSYIIATTMTDHESELPTPTVPKLDLNKKTDTSISVEWDYNYDFEYELVYSRKDNPDEAKVWNFNISHNPQDSNYVANGGKAIVTITGLFPDTHYNIWIKAKQKKGDKVSAWSNPLRVKTAPLTVPAPPTGVGPAAYQSILDIGLDFKPISKDYITVEWVKNPNDTGKVSEGGLEKSYEYDVEFADNVEFLDSVIVTVNEDNIGSKEKNHEILSKNMVKFNKLISNRPYYVRVKTRITLKDTETSSIITRESEYTKWVRILTKSSDDEYDGGENDNVVIYPEDIKEDYDRGVWTIEIVNTQGIITKILNKKDYYFTIDAKLYNDRYDADIRKIRIPKAVLNALLGQNMELRMITNIGKYEIKPQTLDYYIKKAGASDIVEFQFKTVLAYDARHIAKAYPYVMLKGESLSIGTSNNYSPMTKLDGYMKVSTKLPKEADLLYRTIDAYIYTQDTGDWSKQSKTVEQFGGENYLTYTTPILGLYTTYKVESYADEYRISYELQNIANQYGVEELGTIYTGYNGVHSDQYSQLLLGIAKNAPSIKLNNTMSVETRKQAKISGIYIEENSGYLTEEQAISGIVRLYEMKTGYKVKPSSKKFRGVSTAYSNNISKAYALGIIEDINPQKGVSYQTLCEWLIKAGF